jgi:plastocyanin
MQIKRLALVVLSVAALSTAALACGGDSDSDTPADGNGTPAASTTAPAANGGGSEIEVDMKDNFFEPDKITVHVGEAVTFEAKNEGAAIHNMHIFSADAEGKDFMSDALVNPGQSSTFTAQFSKAGTYKFQCDFHTPSMAGEITVQ